MAIDDIIDDIFGGSSSNRRRRPSPPDGGGHIAFIAPIMKPAKINQNRMIFKQEQIFTGGNFTFRDFRLRINSDDTIQVQANIEFGRLVTGFQVAPSPIVAFAFADDDGFFMDEKWVIDAFAKRCADSTIRIFKQDTKINGVFTTTKQLGAMHSAWDFKYC